MLVSIFPGSDSIFTQRGAATLSIELPIILALTWLCLDPLLQAVYIVRAFKWEGLRTGEDLLVRLKRLAPLLLLFALCAPASHLVAAAPTLSRDTLNHSIDQTLQSHDYDWRTPPPPADTQQKDWFLDTVDRTLALVRKGWKVISDLWSDLLDWVGRLLRPIMPASDKTPSGQPSAVRPVLLPSRKRPSSPCYSSCSGSSASASGRNSTLPDLVAGARAVDLDNEGPARHRSARRRVAPDGRPLCQLR